MAPIYIHQFITDTVKLLPHNLYNIYQKHEQERRTAVTSNKLGEWMDAREEEEEMGTGKEMSFDAFG